MQRELLHSLIFRILMVPGIALNSFIISIYFKHWKKKQTFSAHEKIFLSKALSNLFFQGFSILLDLLFPVFTQLPHIGKVYLYARLFFFCTSFFIFWNTAWLSIQYCLKIVNYSNSFLTWLKVRFSSSMTRVIIASLVWIFVIQFPMYWTVALVDRNVTHSTPVVVNEYCLALNFLLGCVLPFIKNLICIEISVIYLLRHVWRIRHNKSKFSSFPEVNGQIRAVRTMVLQVLLNVALQAAITVWTVNSFRLWSFTYNEALKEISEIVILIYPSAEALTLILGNPTLKQKLLRNLKFFLPNK